MLDVAAVTGAGTGALRRSTSSRSSFGFVVLLRCAACVNRGSAGPSMATVATFAPVVMVAISPNFQ